eukprot:scpid101954/ scgid27093/ 
MSSPYDCSLIWGTAYELRPLLLHPDRVDLTSLEVAEYLCRVSTRVLAAGEKRQRLPKIIMAGVDDYGSPSQHDNGMLLRCWDDGRRSMYNVMKAKGAINEAEEVFKDAEEVESSELLKLVKDLNTRKIFRQDA